jgi:hypothetical protein
MCTNCFNIQKLWILPLLCIYISFLRFWQ